MSSLFKDMAPDKAFSDNLRYGGYVRVFVEPYGFVEEIEREICNSHVLENDLLLLHIISRTDSAKLNSILHNLIDEQCITKALARQYLDEQSSYRMSDDFSILADGILVTQSDYSTSTSLNDEMFGNYENFVAALKSIAGMPHDMAYLHYYDNWRFIAMVINANKMVFQNYSRRALADPNLAEHVKEPLRSSLMDIARTSPAAVTVIF